LPDSARHVLENRIQAWSRRPHEPDFAVFRWFRESQPFLVVDAGAHRGHSAISIFGQCKNAEVIAFEPNRNLEPALKWVSRRYRKRFRYHLIGLGDRSGQTRRLVHRAGRRTLSAEAAERNGELDKHYVQERLEDEAHASGSIRFIALTAHIEPLDAFDIDPQFVKIDVEGMEADVIRGASKTLKASLPLVLVEINNHREFFDLLRPMGYEFFSYSPELDCLEPLAGDSDDDLPANAMAVHPRSVLAPWLRFKTA
jgi:FkbM family methyltransferase